MNTKLTRPNSPVLSVRNLSVSYIGAGRKLIPVVENVSLDLQRGKICGLVGESGCGKSTISLALMGLLDKKEAKVSGEVTFQGKDYLDLPKKQLRSLQGSEIAVIFQDPMSSMNPSFTVGFQICEPMRIHLGLSRKDAQARAIALLKRVGISSPASFLGRFPYELSGGMRQRAMIAMAMSCRPKVLIADEPTTALDVTIQAEILQLIVELCKEEGAAILFITHDFGVVAETCDEILVMYAGQVVERSNNMRHVLDDPQHPYTVALLNCLPENNIGSEVLPTISGTVPQPGTHFTGCRFADRCQVAQEDCSSNHIPLYRTSGEHATRCHRLADRVEGVASA
ncbi:ABC transporter ATP-binding protein [Nesterenkonia muleiensis]|uniref:ABC transporter ATP-binding protein n=1 Tax=Nesterenkonia muleiensis TaxID=2282648 RepID=UPI00138FC078|nr:ABC transporter ATP-binding protein [Nesterenkonia muleiensis]